MSTLASERAICSASLTTRSIAAIVPDEAAAVGRDRLDHRRDQLGVGRQRDVLPGAGLDGGDRGAGVGAGAAGDDRRADAFGVERRDERRDRLRDVDHDEVGALGAQHVEALRDRVGLGHGGAALHRDLGGGDELAGEPSDDEKAHVWLRFGDRASDRP